MNRQLIAPVAGTITEIIRRFGKRAFFQNFSIGGRDSNFLIFEGIAVPAIIFPITTDGQVIVINQFRFGANAFVLELPGGCPERENETPEETLRSELLNETGYAPSRIIELGDAMYFEPAALRTRYRPFLALDCTFVQEPKPDAEEIMEVLLYPVGEWLRMICDGKVDDDKSIAVTMRGLTQLGWTFSPPAQ